MGRKCIVPGCGNTDRGKEMMHSLPAEPERFHKWLRIVQREELKHEDRKKYRICDVHFSNEMKVPMYHSTTNLKKLAVPNIHIPSGGTWCAVPNCKTNTKRKTISLFSFPKDFERCKAWILNINRKDLMNIEHWKLYFMKVCAKHFETTMFRNNLQNRLHTHAIPTLLLPNPRAELSQVLLMERNKEIGEITKPAGIKTDSSKVAVSNFKSKNASTVLPCPAAKETPESSQPMKVSTNKRSNIGLRDASQESLKQLKVTSSKRTKWEYEESMCVLVSGDEKDNDEENVDEIQEMPESTTSEAEEQTKPLEQKREHSKGNAHSVDLFLSAIGVTMKSFSPYYQNIAKQRIFSIVSELELEQISS